MITFLDGNMFKIAMISSYLKLFISNKQLFLIFDTKITMSLIIYLKFDHLFA